MPKRTGQNGICRYNHTLPDTNGKTVSIQPFPAAAGWNIKQEENRMTFKEFVAKAKKANKKDLAKGIGCIVGMIALIVWMITWFF